MQIYIEYFLIDNIIINLIVLYLVGFTTKVKLNKILMLLVSILGAIFSVIYSQLNLINIFDFIYKILIGIVMILSLKKYKSLPKVNGVNRIYELTRIFVEYVDGKVISARMESFHFFY